MDLAGFEPAPATLTGCCASVTPQAHALKPNPAKKPWHNCQKIFSHKFPKQHSLRRAVVGLWRFMSHRGPGYNLAGSNLSLRDAAELSAPQPTQRGFPKDPQ